MAGRFYPGIIYRVWVRFFKPGYHTKPAAELFFKCQQVVDTIFFLYVVK